MTYHKLSFSCNTKDTGPVYPQIQKMKDNYDYKSSNSIYALSRYHEGFPNFRPDLDGFILHGRAKLTDFLSNGIVSSGILLSEKAKGVLGKCNLIGCKFLDAKVYHKNDKIDYYWMHVISQVRPYVDYERSKFFIYKNFSTRLKYINISSEEDLILKQNILKENNPGQTLAIWAETIRFNSNFDKKNDFFMVGKFDGSYYVSEKLYNLFVKHNITGVEFSNAENIIIT